jgi:hypothetical protein
MDAEGLVKISRDNIPYRKINGTSEKKMERLNPGLKQAESSITKKTFVCN